MTATGDRARWVWAVGGAIALVAAGSLLFRAPVARAPERIQRSVSVSLRSDPGLQDEAAVFDPTPLFQPTKLNAAPKPIELREPGSAFPSYQPKLGFAETELKLDSLSLPQPVKVPPSPALAPGADARIWAVGRAGSGPAGPRSVCRDNRCEDGPAPAAASAAGDGAATGRRPGVAADGVRGGRGCSRVGRTARADRALRGGRSG
jgi:hypothetical protein